MKTCSNSAVHLKIFKCIWERSIGCLFNSWMSPYVCMHTFAYLIRVHGIKYVYLAVSRQIATKNAHFIKLILIGFFFLVRVLYDNLSLVYSYSKHINHDLMKKVMPVYKNSPYPRIQRKYRISIGIYSLVLITLYFQKATTILYAHRFWLII